jgi:hypothetical protein
MDFLKRHYEKIILSIVLLGLALAAALLPFAIQKAKEDLEAMNVTAPPPKPFKPINLTTNEAAIARLKNPPKVDFSGEHNVFNPVVWKQFADGSLRKIPTSNPAELLKIDKIVPLQLVISYDRATTTGYYFSIMREAMVSRANARKQQRYAKVGEKVTFPGVEGKPIDLFTVRELKGPPEDPTEFAIELAETREVVSIGKEKPYVRVEGYSADLQYELGNKKFVDTRKGASLAFEGDIYNVIAILKNEVRVQAFSNLKITTVSWKGAP